MWDTALSPSAGPPSLGSQNTDEEREAQREHTAVKPQNQELRHVCACRSCVSSPHSLSLEQTPRRAQRLVCDSANRPERKQGSQTICIAVDDSISNEDEAHEG